VKPNTRATTDQNYTLEKIIYNFAARVFDAEQMLQLNLNNNLSSHRLVSVRNTTPSVIFRHLRHAAARDMRQIGIYDGADHGFAAIRQSRIRRRCAWSTQFNRLICDVRTARGPKRQTIALEGAVHSLRGRVDHGSRGRIKHDKTADECEGGERRNQTTRERSRTAERRPGCAELDW